MQRKENQQVQQYSLGKPSSPVKFHRVLVVDLEVHSIVTLILPWVRRKQNLSIQEL